MQIVVDWLCCWMEQQNDGYVDVGEPGILCQNREEQELI